MVTISTPASMSWLACVCLNAWNVTSGILICDALNKFVTDNGAKVVSVPWADPLRIEVAQGSSLPVKLRELGCWVRSAGKHYTIARLQGGRCVGSFQIAMSFKGELAAYEGSHENKPVTLPVFQFKEFDREAVAKKARIGTRTIKAGLAAWEAIGEANRFENWKRIGAALAIGKTYTLRVTGANAAWGKTYRSVFGQWMKNRGFGSMRPSERSYAIAFI
jgi:hypothetical protein